MDFGVGLPAYADEQSRLPPTQLTQFTHHAARAGFTCAWMGEHIIQPPTYHYLRSEPLTTLSFLAGATEDIELGTAVILLPLRHPVHVAKAAANIQYHADRRFTLGVGMGYADTDFNAIGVPREERSARFTEALTLLNKLLTEDEVSFSGTYYSVEAVRIEPQLEQPPRILIGGGGVTRNGSRHVPAPVKERILHSDGWITSSAAPPDVAGKDWEDFKNYIETHDRNPENFTKYAQYRTYLVPTRDATRAKEVQLEKFTKITGEQRDAAFVEEHYGIGTIETIQTDIARFKQLGFDHVNLIPSTTTYADLTNQLELLEEHIITEFSS